MAVYDVHDFKPASPRANRVIRPVLRAALMLSLALIVACSGGSDERGPDDRPRGNGPGDFGPGRDSDPGSGQGDGERFERSADGNIPPIAPPPTVGEPTATTTPPNTSPGVTGTNSTATPSLVVDQRIFSCLIDADHETLEGIQYSLTAGEQVFQTLGCAECHVPGTFIDGQTHDVGTGDPALEKNSHGRGTAFETPSLRGLWLTAPYLHDGRATTLEDVLRSGTTHNVVGDLSSDEIDDLVAYLLALPIGN